MNYFTAQIDGSKSSKLANALITPLRWFANGRHYKVLHKNNDLLIPIKHKTLSKSHATTRKIFGLLGTILLSPLVITGLLIKCASSFRKFRAKDITFSKKIFSLAPINIEPPSNDDTTSNLNELITIWDRVGQSNSQYSAIKQQLTTWINDKVPNPNQYTFINQTIATEAAAKLQRYLDYIIVELQTADENIAERTLTALYDASLVCSPTWIEIAAKEYSHLKGGGTQKERILRYIQDIKEDLILEYGRQYTEFEWHVLNYARHFLGKEFGLNRSNIKYDANITDNVQLEFTKERCCQIFYQIFTENNLIQGLIAKINLDTKGNYDQDLNALLKDRALKLAQDEQIDTQSNKFDIAMYTLEKFFDEKDGKYLINEMGVKQILIAIDLSFEL